MNLTALTLATTSAAASATSSSSQSSMGEMLVSLLPIILIFVVFYFILIRPQRKREKETNKMRSEIQVGDEITTTGGVIGRVVNIKEDSLIIETGADRTKIRIKKWAIQSCDTIHDA